MVVTPTLTRGVTLFTFASHLRVQVPIDLDSKTAAITMAKVNNATPLCSIIVHEMIGLASWAYFKRHHESIMHAHTPHP
jgi:hypothetical protein